MNDLKKAAQQALEALGFSCPAPHLMSKHDAAVTALRAALAQQEQEQEQEPVAWMVTDKDGRHFIFRINKPVISEGETLTPLYTHPPRREWQSLTEEEIRELTFHNQRTLWPRPDRSDVRATAIPFARAIEQALKERNT
jgi:hypothetical protein